MKISRNGAIWSVSLSDNEMVSFGNGGKFMVRSFDLKNIQTRVSDGTKGCIEGPADIKVSYTVSISETEETKTVVFDLGDGKNITRVYDKTRNEKLFTKGWRTNSFYTFVDELIRTGTFATETERPVITPKVRAPKKETFHAPAAPMKKAETDKVLKALKAVKKEMVETAEMVCA